MDVNTLRIGITLASMVAFFWIVYRAYRPSRRAELERQGRSILDDEAEGRTP